MGFHDSPAPTQSVSSHSAALPKAVPQLPRPLRLIQPPHQRQDFPGKLPSCSRATENMARISNSTNQSRCSPISATTPHAMPSEAPRGERLTFVGVYEMALLRG
ncbi:hypothetical protein HBH82_215390 [Parastagonospora nodorum]|nr:hypothetical protein HBH82_215390 [Parastagonospora nodorum]KAH6204311.1 hypothetical protein HBI43_200010 [Parastagonospora nodorum]